MRSFEVLQVKYLQHCTSYSAKRLHLDHRMDDHSIQQVSEPLPVACCTRTIQLAVLTHSTLGAGYSICRRSLMDLVLVIGQHV